MADSKGIKAGEAFVELTTRDAALRKGLDAASARIKSFGASITGIGTKLFAVGAAGAAPFAPFVATFAEVGSGLKDISDRVGLTVEAVSELGFAAQMSGT